MGHFFPQHISFRGLGLALYRKQTTRNLTQPIIIRKHPVTVAATVTVTVSVSVTVTVGARAVTVRVPPAYLRTSPSASEARGTGERMDAADFLQ